MSEFALWYEKYRPETLDDYVWVAEDLKSRVTFWIADPEKLPHLVLYGPPGTGKTTLALIIGHGVAEDDLLYINTNKHSGVDAIRDLVTNFCEAGGFDGLKVVLIDEADGLSIAAQDKLRGVINDYGSFVRFIFTANKIRALSDAIKSRARVFEVKALDEDQFLQRLIDIASTEGINVEDDANAMVVGEVFEATYPDLRRAIDVLQDCHRDDKLIPPSQASGGAPEWASGLASALVNCAGAGYLRELVVSLRRDEILDVYRYIYEHSNELFKEKAKEMAALVIVKENMVRHGTAAFPDILLAGMLCELVQLQEMT